MSSVRCAIGDDADYEVILIASPADIRMLEQGVSVSPGSRRTLKMYVITDTAWEAREKNYAFGCVVHWDLGEDWKAFLDRLGCFQTSWQTVFRAAIATGNLRAFEVS